MPLRTYLANALGEIAGVVSTRDGAEPGIWSGLPGSLTRVIKPNDPAPGAPGAVFSGMVDTIPDVSLTDSGKLTFRALLSGGGVNSANDRGIWIGHSGDYALVVREGQAAPGTASGVTFGTVNSFFSNDSHVAFGASLLGPGITPTDRSSAWLGSPSGLTLLARADDLAPGLGSGISLAHINLRDFTDTGLVALTTKLAGPSVNETNNQALWLGQPGSLSLAARTGDQAPGLPDGVTISSLGEAKVNGSGQVAFFAGIAGAGVVETNDTGLWIGTPGNLSLVVREGNQVPGLAAGVVFHSLSSTQSFSGLQLNSAGSAAFIGTVSGPAISIFDDDWIWLHTAAGLTRLAAGENSDVFLNDVGQVAYASGGNEILLFTPTPVPEPSTLAFAAIMVTAAIGRSLRRRTRTRLS